MVITNSVELYDPAKNEWFQAAQMLERRYYPHAGAVNDFVYVFGGMCDNGSMLTSSERYSIKDNTWAKVNNFCSKSHHFV